MIRTDAHRDAYMDRQRENSKPHRKQSLQWYNKEEPIKNEGARVVTKNFKIYNAMGAICCHGNQSSDRILPKT